MTSCGSWYSFVETCAPLGSFEELRRVSTKAASTDTIPDNDQSNRDGKDKSRESENQKAGGDERESEIRERDAPERLPRRCAEVKRSFFLGAVHFLEAGEEFRG